MLLFLLPPFCIVAPIRELANKLFSTTTIALQPLQMAYIPSTIYMDSDIVRKRSTFSSKNRSRKSSIFLTIPSMAYHK